MPNSPMSMLRLMPSRADEVARFSKSVIESVKTGNANAIEVLVMLRSLEAVSELVREEIQDNVMNAVDKYSGKTIEAFGARIEKSEVGVKYNYISSGDSEWEAMDSELRSLKHRISEREAFLKGLKEPMDVLHKETGEIETIRPPQKTSKSGVKVYLASR
jgi:hypothetical protein